MKNLLAMLSVSALVVGAPLKDELALQEAFEPTIAQPSLADMNLPMPALMPAHKSPFAAVGLSWLFPGLGHVYLGDMSTAGGLSGSAGLELGIGLLSFPSRSVRDASLITLQKTWEYGIYAAYRDVRLHNGNIGYSYKMPTENLADLTAAPFQWSVLKKPEVWGGFLGAFAVAIGVSQLAGPKNTHSKEVRIHKVSTGRKISPWVALPVGVGEEAFFRGYLQPAFSEMTNPTGGIILSSLAFGAAHIPNGLAIEKQDRKHYYKVGIPFITAFGAYFGWVAHKNQSLKEGVALHTWYDFTLFALSAAVTETAVTGQPTVHVMIPF